MITRESIKAEIDKVQDRYLEVLYRIIRALVNPSELVAATPHNTVDVQNEIEMLNWHRFIEETYGSLADDPIKRGEQGQYEVREAIE